MIRKISRLIVISGIAFGFTACGTAEAAESAKSRKTGRAAASKSKEATANKSTKDNQITFEAIMKDGKKIWSPAEVSVEIGKPTTITVINKLPEPHGFQIENEIGPETIGAGETKTYHLKALKRGNVKVSCHLHPGHVPATIHFHMK